MSFDTVLIVGLYVACELIANTTAGKPVLLPGGITVPAAVFIYALTFTLIDLVNDRVGKQGARYVVYVAFLANLPPEFVTWKSNYINVGNTMLNGPLTHMQSHVEQIKNAISAARK